MASASNRQTLTANGSTLWRKFIGPVQVSFSGAFLGGTVKVQRRDSSGAAVDVSGTSKIAADDLLIEFPPGAINWLRTNLAGASATSPLTSFVAEMGDGETRLTT